MNTPQKKPHVPNYPKDDRNVSKKATPASKGARPCWHCGSGNHWDNECKFSKKNATEARVHFASITGDELEEQDSYETLAAASSSDSEPSSSESESTDDSESDQDFP